MMNRLFLPLLALLLVVLVTADHLSRRQRDQQRALASDVRPLLARHLEVVPDRVRHIQLQLGTRRQTWSYIREGHSWRYPAYFNAFAQVDRIDFLLRSLLEGVGTVVADDGGVEDATRGLSDEQALKVRFLGSDNRLLLESWIGRGIPDLRSAESYLKRTADATVFHWHANPRHALDGGNPPMIDRLVLPRALGRKALVAISISTAGNLSLALRREDLPIEIREDGMPMPPAPGSSHVWLATFEDGSTDTCRIENVHAYTSMLKGLTFERLNDPATMQGSMWGEGAREFVLTDEDGVADLLTLQFDERGEALLYSKSTRLLSTIAAARAALLTPTREALLAERLPAPAP
jgi:hypothetical protein